MDFIPIFTILTETCVSFGVAIVWIDNSLVRGSCVVDVAHGFLACVAHRAATFLGNVKFESSFLGQIGGRFPSSHNNRDE